MKLFSLQQGNWQQGFSAVCESLVHPAVQDGDLRRAHARLLGLLFVGPFLAAMLLVQLLHERVSAPGLLAMICLTFALFWIGAAAAAATPATRVAVSVSLGGLAVLTGLAIGGTGGLASPVTLLLLVPAVEMWWLGRRPAPHGWTLAGLSLALALVLQLLLPAMQVSPDLWLVPAAYGATVWLRLRRARQSGAAQAAPQPAADLSELARISGDCLVVLDRRGHVEAIHGPLAERLGLPAELLMGSGLFDRLHVTDRVFYLSTLDTVRAKGAAAEVRLRVRAAGDAGFRLLALVASPSTSGGCIACLRDCSEIESLQGRLETAEGRLAELEKGKGRFLATVSHELRTPLNAIIGFADMLDNEIAGPLKDPRQKDYVRLIGQSGQHLLSVVNAILDVSKIESGNYDVVAEPFRVEEAVDMCLSMMKLQAEAKKIRLSRRVSPGVGLVRADRRAVQQMLINLLANAIKFTPEGGRIELTADATGAHLVLRVSDNGIGMASAEVARIGRPFTQLRHSDQEQGSGLGLHLVKGLVSLHDGSMEIDSAPSLGTTVTIRLPLDGPGGSPVHELRIENSGRQQETEREDAAERRCA